MFRVHQLRSAMTGLVAMSALLLVPLAQADSAQSTDYAQRSAPKGQAAKSEKNKPYPKLTAPIERARIIAALRQDYEPNPAIWRMADEDTTIYLFGTVHVLHRDFKWRSDAVDAVIAEADSLVLETTEEQEQEMLNVDLFTSMFEATAERGVLSAKLDKDNRPKLAKLAGQIGLPVPVVEHMPVWLLTFFTFYETAEDFGSVNEYGVETVLTRLFKRAGKPISAIEDGEAVMAAMNSLDETEMIAELNTALSKWSGRGPLFGEAEQIRDPAAYYADDHGWAKGDTSAMEAGLTREELGDAFYNVLLADRNRAWAEWLDDRMDKPGTVLVAVGAGHLAGPDSVQVMLDKRGLKTERIR
ncbi:TraB/GumN family protein [Alterisphingorhabdus coralli]|uniref:TraB/GumN family protein n=1 Tax=Alterisphingorhabdus coralli TaxID=3071408 RepID=A0AA97I1T8_9SPHN|nr:TraB/GumN family protein [Parasphingorhabdus sp. SCSIO 66989]WOE76427.1 TraB/GumN family protein [Parasphingorhabdus sp. SCSIO 66989]